MGVIRMWIKFYLRRYDEMVEQEIARVRDYASARLLESEYRRVYSNGKFYLAKKEGRKKRETICYIATSIN